MRVYLSPYIRKGNHSGPSGFRLIFAHVGLSDVMRIIGGVGLAPVRGICERMQVPGAVGSATKSNILWLYAPGMQAGVCLYLVSARQCQYWCGSVSAQLFAKLNI